MQLKLRKNEPKKIIKIYFSDCISRKLVPRKVIYRTNPKVTDVTILNMIEVHNSEGIFELLFKNSLISIVSIPR